MKSNKRTSGLIIRKRSSFLTNVRRALILVILWLITGYVIYINVCFLLNAYSDALVSDYLVLNLSFRAYASFALLVLAVAILMIAFGWWRIRRLERRARNHD
ncbi:hypothetical protein KTE19_01040 [Lentilactobacillus sp. IMAU92037]|uniref:hypothetical protein n=1 Tax=Lentilactobacillus TaxID=2767893 RepID=UPI001C258CE0|nr:MULTISPECIES: hypothetical protein [Lentilactobacillus]MBU9788296.1 hypothetical protein [Lentilactobacillus dabitei]MBV0929315.1 hypothetical protein [Lentilactobacillus dabitei]MDM7516021.1 hypothetical protein [Lentilactobacillus sp. TOM.63]